MEFESAAQTLPLATHAANTQPAGNHLEQLPQAQTQQQHVEQQQQQQQQQQVQQKVAQTEGDGTGRRWVRPQISKPTRRCQHPEGCAKTPSYNFPGEKKRLYCAAHKLQGMENLTNKWTRCGQEGCTKRATFNLEGKKARYCDTHKQPGMVNVTDRKCREEDCKKLPTYGWPGQHHKLCCASHREQGMVDYSHAKNRI